MAEEKKEEEMEQDESKHYIVLTDEDGKDTKVELLFSIVYKKTNTRYLYVVDPGDDSAVIIFSSDEEGNLESVAEDNITPELKEFLEDTFQAFQNGDLAPVEDGEEGEEEEIEEDEEEDEEHHCCCCEGDSCTCGEEDKDDNKEHDCCCHHDDKEGEEHECCHKDGEEGEEHHCCHKDEKAEGEEHHCCHHHE